MRWSTSFPGWGNISAAALTTVGWKEGSVFPRLLSIDVDELLRRLLRCVAQSALFPAAAMLRSERSEEEGEAEEPAGDAVETILTLNG
eukprot:CAMPEP_0176136294 /NCGR_PEP_ID=MMETSP0120_2-20121206/69162_1 /TAXON_ID=160619 /ORGANISM="Kryptoperidinium foliaceum, Strain CCMP 1326" /LENGTH=87 /DNA_ID=CAMNT_0017472057 /DNA_START=62 /DNA_END=325 /DNA_ORIENTATION=-